MEKKKRTKADTGLIHFKSVVCSKSPSKDNTVIIKRPIQERNNVVKVQVKPSLCNSRFVVETTLLPSRLSVQQTYRKLKLFNVTHCGNQKYNPNNELMMQEI